MSIDLYQFHWLRKYLRCSVIIEINSTCNLKCVGCPRTNRDYRSKNKIMTMERFKHYCDMLPKNIRGIGLNGFGEPLLHPNLYEIMDYCKHRHPKANLVMTTNLLMKDVSLYDKLFHHNISLLHISVDSLDGFEANMIRPDTDVELLRANIEHMIENYADKIKLWITINRINQDSAYDLAKELLEMGALSIKFQFFMAHGRPDLCLKEKEIEEAFEWIKNLRGKYFHIIEYSPWYKKPKKACQRLVHGFVITVDGRMQGCCNFFAMPLNLGDLNKKDVKDIFFSKSWTEMYKQMKKGVYPKFCGTYTDDGTCGAKHV